MGVINNVPFTLKIAPVGTLNYMVTLPKFILFQSTVRTSGKDTMAETLKESPNLKESHNMDTK